jgi:hypothetical protein
MIFVLLLSAIFMQPPTVLLPTEAFAFEFPDAALEGESIDRFEVSYDAGPFASLGMPPKLSTVSGVSKYKLIPPQTSGTHSFSLRACNVVGCGPASSPFAFVPLSNPVTIPGNITKVPR